ncbi:hypothetical protein GCM10009808_22690 [Microbacterium sediminicola]|uniref:Gram-positive cocci surface proteins LPxTG domain-containing protein n=1 Tax=Microbacterium sediminicola TaxID=415210 RepID=A0ABP4UI28_9MICO
MVARTFRSPLAILLSCLLVVAMLALSPAAVAAETEGSESREVGNWSDLRAAFSSGGSIVLTSDISNENGENLVTSSSGVTLDLNGHRLDISIPGPDDNDHAFPGIEVTGSASLTIDDSAGNGELHATGGKMSAGIGGGRDTGDPGTIVINAGTITATGTSGGAGIGGAAGTAGPGAHVTVNGGSVTATSDSAAGIGGGDGQSYGGRGGTLVVTGGSVTAVGGRGSAGVGGGRAWDVPADDACESHGGFGGDVIVSGGTLTASGEDGGPGIGGGAQWCTTGSAGDGGNVTITGGTVVATGGDSAPGIGGGAAFGEDWWGFLPGGTGGAGPNLTMSHGSLTAVGGASAPAVGSGHTNNAWLGGGEIQLHTRAQTASDLPRLTGGGEGNEPATISFTTGGSYNISASSHTDGNRLEIAYLPFHSVTYDANGGEGTVPDAGSYEENTVVEVANGGALTMDHYQFNGWNTSADGSGTAYAPGSSLTVTSDVTLYAQWIVIASYEYALSFGVGDSAVGSTVWITPTDTVSSSGSVSIESSTGTGTWIESFALPSGNVSAPLIPSAGVSAGTYTYRVQQATGVTDAVGLFTFTVSESGTITDITPSATLSIDGVVGTSAATVPITGSGAGLRPGTAWELRVTMSDFVTIFYTSGTVGADGAFTVSEAVDLYLSQSAHRPPYYLVTLTTTTSNATVSDTAEIRVRESGTIQEVKAHNGPRRVDAGVGIFPMFEMTSPLKGSTAYIGGVGLEPGTDWTAVVESDPITIASGTVDTSEQFVTEATMPDSLPEGNHTLTVSGTSPTGETVTSVLYFTVTAEGYILYVSPDGPRPATVTETSSSSSDSAAASASNNSDLAETGATPSWALPISAAATLVLGVLLVTLRRRRRA